MERTLWSCHTINAKNRRGITPPSGTYQSCPEVGGSFHAHDKEVGGAEKLFAAWEIPSKGISVYRDAETEKAGWPGGGGADGPSVPGV